jgi:hypothetical protein
MTAMDNPNRRLLQILTVGWLAFIGAGFGLRQVLSGPAVTLIIDRSYCDPTRWQQITDDYGALYEQHQQQRLTIEQVIYVSDLGQEVARDLPTPETLQDMGTYGRFNGEQLQQATAEHPQATVLVCGEGNQS